MTNDAESHKKGPGSSGYGLKSALTVLPRLKIQPVFPAHGALPKKLIRPILGHNAAVDMFETASSENSTRIASLVNRLIRNRRPQVWPSRAIPWFIFGILCAVGVKISAEINTADQTGLSAELINLEFSIGDIEFSPSFRLRGISVGCTMLAYSSNQFQRNQATLLIRDSPVGQISIAARLKWYPVNRRWTVDAKGAVGTTNKLEFHLDRSADDTHLVIDLGGFDITRLPRFIDPLPPALAEYDIDSGTLQLNADCRFKAGIATACDVDGKLENINVNGVNVAENVAMDFGLAYVVGGSGTQLDFSMSLQHGAIYVEPGFTLGGINPGFFITATDPPIDVAARVELMQTGEIRVLSADLLHPVNVEMHYAGDLTIAPSLKWRALDFTLHASEVEDFYATYISLLHSILHSVHSKRPAV